MRALEAALRDMFPNRKPAVIFGALADKNVAEMCERIAGMRSRVVVCPVRSNRAMPVEELAGTFRQLFPELSVTVCPSLEEALSTLREEPLVVVTGSLYLVGEALELLNLSPIPAAGEHALNHSHSSGPITY